MSLDPTSPRTPLGSPAARSSASRSAALLLFSLFFSLFFLGCAHGIELRSEPAGAEVFVEGERVGTTPLVLETLTGEVDGIPVEVRQGDVSARFEIQQAEWAPMPLVAGVGLYAAGLAGGTAVAIGGYLLLLQGLIGPSASFGAVGVGVAAYALGIVGLSLASVAPFVAAGMFGRKGPDSVFVDFAEGEVRSNPAGRIEPLIGVLPGQRALRWRDEEE